MKGFLQEVGGIAVVGTADGAVEFAPDETGDEFVGRAFEPHESEVRCRSPVNW